MQEKIMSLSLSEKLLAGGGILMVIASFLPWYHYSANIEGIIDVSYNRSAWQSPNALWSMLAVLISAALVVVVLGPKLANLQLPNLGSITWTQAKMGMAAAVVVLVIIKFLSETSYLGFGFFIGVIAAALIGAGCYLVDKEAKTGVTRT